MYRDKDSRWLIWVKVFPICSIVYKDWPVPGEKKFKSLSPALTRALFCLLQGLLRYPRPLKIIIWILRSTLVCTCLHPSHSVNHPQHHPWLCACKDNAKVSASTCLCMVFASKGSYLLCCHCSTIGFVYCLPPCDDVTTWMPMWDNNAGMQWPGQDATTTKPSPLPLLLCPLSPSPSHCWRRSILAFPPSLCWQWQTQHTAAITPYLLPVCWQWGRWIPCAIAIALSPSVYQQCDDNEDDMPSPSPSPPLTHCLSTRNMAQCDGHVECDILTFCHHQSQWYVLHTHLYLIFIPPWWWCLVRGVTCVYYGGCPSWLSLSDGSTISYTSSGSTTFALNIACSYFVVVQSFCAVNIHLFL